MSIVLAKESDNLVKLGPPLIRRHAASVLHKLLHADLHALPLKW